MCHFGKSILKLQKDKLEVEVQNLTMSTQHSLMSTLRHRQGLQGYHLKLEDLFVRSFTALRLKATVISVSKRCHLIFAMGHFWMLTQTGAILFGSSHED